MPIYASKRSIRAVVDACLDMGGIEQITSSQNTQWTTHYTNYWSNAINNPNTVYFYFHVEWMDNNGDFPFQDQCIEVGTSVFVVSNAQTDTGFKALQHQAQCMKGKPGATAYGPLQGGTQADAMAGDHVTYLQSFTTPSTINIERVHDGAGTFKHNNISLGGFRGLQYSQNDVSIWSTGDNSDSIGSFGERLYRTGAVSVGDAA